VPREQLGYSLAAACCYCPSFEDCAHRNQSRRTALWSAPKADSPRTRSVRKGDVWRSGRRLSAAARFTLCACRIEDGFCLGTAERLHYSLDLNFPDYAAGLPQSVGRFQSVAPTAAVPAGGISGSSAPSPPSFEQLAPPPNLVLVIHTLNHERPREHLEPTVRAYGRRPRRPLGGASSTPSWRA
jgi:hypothetical protein